MIKTKRLDYADGRNTFQGFLAWDDRYETKIPVVLVAHAFSGQSAFEESKAMELAKAGYLGFAIDLYGKGKRAQSPAEAQALMQELNSDRKLLLERMLLSIETIKKHNLADVTRIGAIGFCFGGKCVLDLARSGADVRAVVSFHGVYDKPGLSRSGPVKASVLILHGWDDPLGRPEKLTELAQELTELNADWSVTAYGHTGHAFTNPEARSPERGIFYNKKSDARAWKSMLVFFEEQFL